MSRFLFVTWDGAGNLVPTLGIARRLSGRGHDVRVLGHRSIAERCGHDGWRFRALRHARDFDACVPRETDDMAMVAKHIWFDPAICRDVREELSAEPADLIVCDCLLIAGLSAAIASSIPTVALFHGAFTLFRRGPFFNLLTTLLPSLNAIRAALGLAAVARISDVHDACALSLVAGPCEFEPPATVPDNVRFVGPILDAPLLTANGDDIEFEPRGLPLIVVSFSTGDQGQRDVLQRMVDALAGVPADVVVTTGPAIDPASVRTSGNVRAVRFAPHARLLPHASLLVTHAGMGTVMAGLAHGVPLLCVPLGRDQFFNAARVESLGAGITLPADTEAPAIADAVRMLVHNAAMRRGAQRAAEAIARYRNGREAVNDLERLVSGTAAPAAPARVIANDGSDPAARRSA